MVEGSLLAIPHCFRDPVTCYVPGVSLVITLNGEKILGRYCRTVVSEKLNYFLGFLFFRRFSRIRANNQVRAWERNA